MVDFFLPFGRDDAVIAIFLLLLLHLPNLVHIFVQIIVICK